MKVTVSLSDQQLNVLASLSANDDPAQLVAAAFDEFCRDHPELTGERRDDG